jgi:hypothetical protein
VFHEHSSPESATAYSYERSFVTGKWPLPALFFYWKFNGWYILIVYCSRGDSKVWNSHVRLGAGAKFQFCSALAKNFGFF